MTRLIYENNYLSLGSGDDLSRCHGSQPVALSKNCMKGKLSGTGVTLKDVILDSIMLMAKFHGTSAGNCVCPS